VSHDHPAREWRGGHRANNFGERRIMIVFAILFLVLAGVAVLIAVLREPPAPKPVCPSNKPCTRPVGPVGLPQADVSSSPALVFKQAFTSQALGYRVEYPSLLSTANETPTGVTLLPTGNAPVVLAFDGAASSAATPAQLLNSAVSSLQAKIPDIQISNDAAEQILAPALGERAGVGGFYQGNFDSPSGIVAPVDIAILASSDGQETITVAVISTDRSQTDHVFGFADQAVLDTLRFRGDIPQ
jgi:hypothetical protein